MSSNGKAFQLGAVVVPIHAALSMQQTIESFGGHTVLRLGDGGAVPQTVWRKLRVTISAEGWSPPGLRALNFDAPLTLKCGAPTSIASTSNVITLPTARRTDAGYLPFARAHTEAGWSDTPVAVVSNTATCTVVSGALGYSVWYYPELYVVCEPPAESFDRSGAAVSWELTAEEV